MEPIPLSWVSPMCHITAREQMIAFSSQTHSVVSLLFLLLRVVEIRVKDLEPFPQAQSQQEKGELMAVSSPVSCF